MSRVLIAGFGNLLRGDDGFGVVVAQALTEDPPADSTVVEISIAGAALAQELMRGYQALIVLDAVVLGGAPGTLYVLEPTVENPAEWSLEARRAFAADAHYTEPSKAIMLARALGVLPPVVRILACEPGEVDELLLTLSPAVVRAVPIAVERARALVRELGAGVWECGGVGDPAATPGALTGIPGTGYPRGVVWSLCPAEEREPGDDRSPSPFALRGLPRDALTPTLSPAGEREPGGDWSLSTDDPAAPDLPHPAPSRSGDRSYCGRSSVVGRQSGDRSYGEDRLERDNPFNPFPKSVDGSFQPSAFSLRRSHVPGDPASRLPG